MTGEAATADFSTRKKVVFALVIVGSLTVMIEGAARIWLAFAVRPTVAVDVASGLRETRWFDALAEDMRESGADLYVPDAKLFWTLRPGTSVEVKNTVYKMRTSPVTWNIRINEDGFRGPPYPKAGHGASPVIATLGDSCTFGFRVDEDQTYPAQLQKFLRSHGLAQAAVVNYGVPGYTSFQGNRLLGEILTHHRPDVVILAFGANDLEADVSADATRAENISPARLRLHGALTHLATARLFLGGAAWRRTEPHRAAPTPRVSPDEYRRNLLAMIRAARGSGARVILVDFVMMGPVFREDITRLARQEDIAWLGAREIMKNGLDDLLAGRRFSDERARIDRFWAREVEQYRLVYYDETFYRKLHQDPIWSGLLRYLMVEPVHPSPLGQRLIAEEVGRLILAQSAR